MIDSKVVGFGQGLNEVWIVVQESEGWLLSALRSKAEALRTAEQLNKQHKLRTAVARFTLDPMTAKGFDSLEEHEEDEEE